MVSGRSSINSSFRSNDASFRSNLSNMTDMSDASQRRGNIHTLTKNDSQSTKVNSVSGGSSNTRKDRRYEPELQHKTVSRSNSRNNSRIKLTALNEEQDAEESVENIPLPNDINVVQINPPKKREEKEREYTINEVKLPSEQPPKRHKMSRPQLLKFLDNRDTSKDSRDRLGRNGKSAESPNNMNNTSVNLNNGTPMSSQKKENPHKNIYNT